MHYLGDKMAVAQTHVTQWAASARRSLQDVLNLVVVFVHKRTATDDYRASPSAFKRTFSFHHFAKRSHEFFRRFSVSGQHRVASLRKREHPDPDQLKQCFGRPAEGAKDTETLVPESGDNQYGTWKDQQGNAESFAPESPSSESVSIAVSKPTPASSRLSSLSCAIDTRDASCDPDLDSADAEPAKLSAPLGTTPDFSFLDRTPVLDSSAMKTRVQLSKRRRQRRTPISNSLRRSGGGQEEGQPQTSKSSEPNGAWMVRGSTGEKPSEEEGRPRSTERSAAPQTQQLPVFPGMDHSAFKAQLRKRHEPDATMGTGSGVSTQSSSRSPKSLFHAHGSRIPPIAATEKEERSEEASPKWLKELKAKKRQSHYENQV